MLAALQVLPPDQAEEDVHKKNHVAALLRVKLGEKKVGGKATRATVHSAGRI